MLIVFAWISVSFNLNAVYKPMMSAFGYRDDHVEAPTVIPRAGDLRHLDLMAKATGTRRGRRRDMRTPMRPSLGLVPRSPK
jgi:hypothetical protein